MTDAQTEETTPEETAVPGKLREALQPFLDRNPLSQLVQLTEFEHPIVAIASPWGESSLVLEVSDSSNELVDSLQHIYLPPRLSAVLHKDTRRLEVIWSAYKVPDTIGDVVGRRFVFRYEGAAYHCEFGDASSRLLAIADAYIPVGASETNYRNLTSFKRFLSEKNEEILNRRFGKPVSFWISDIDLDDDKLVELLTSLNFYIHYYDTRSPVVLIHPPNAAGSGTKARLRFRHSSFPSTINARSIDPQLLQFWAACGPADSARRFLYSYRIIEHSAFFFVENAPRQAVKKVLNSPHVLDDIEKVTQEVIAAVQKSRFDDYAKFETLLQQTVDPAILWREIDNNIAPFSQEIVFDGEYKLPALVAGAKSKDDFMLNGIKNFCNVSRKIRNALSHGKEERSAAVITPTSLNYERLGPWAHLMQVAAGEVILYNGL